MPMMGDSEIRAFNITCASWVMLFFSAGVAFWISCRKSRQLLPLLPRPPAEFFPPRLTLLRSHRVPRCQTHSSKGPFLPEIALLDAHQAACHGHVSQVIPIDDDGRYASSVFICKGHQDANCGVPASPHFLALRPSSRSYRDRSKNSPSGGAGSPPFRDCTMANSATFVGNRRSERSARPLVAGAKAPIIVPVQMNRKCFFSFFCGLKKWIKTTTVGVDYPSSDCNQRSSHFRP